MLSINLANGVRVAKFGCVASEDKEGCLPLCFTSSAGVPDSSTAQGFLHSLDCSLSMMMRGGSLQDCAALTQMCFQENKEESCSSSF